MSGHVSKIILSLSLIVYVAVAIFYFHWLVNFFGSRYPRDFGPGKALAVSFVLGLLWPLLVVIAMPYQFYEWINRKLKEKP